MASPYQVEVKLSSASNLKNVNWRNGTNRPYAVIWVDPTQKRSTNVDDAGNTHANWNEKLTIPLPPASKIDDATLFVDIIHASCEPDAKSLIIGSANLRLIEVGVGERISRTLRLTRPSGRPQGTVDVRVLVKDTRYPTPRANDTPAHGVSYSVPPPTAGYGAPAGTPYAQASYGYGQPSYGFGQKNYGYGQHVQTTVNVAVAAPDHKKTKVMGFGTGLAVGAVAGGTFAFAGEKCVDILEDKIADRAAEKFEEDYSGHDF
ncbi:BAHD acyltransferase DCR [Spatholobus suberectus]|nr:BAHD acyltransferase DCR [Spatholobus suberectus]